MSRHKNVARMVLEELVKSPGASVSDLAKKIGASLRNTRVEVGRLWDHGLLISRPGLGNKKALYARPEVSDIIEQTNKLHPNCILTASYLHPSWSNLDPERVWKEFEAENAGLDTPKTTPTNYLILLINKLNKLLSFQSISFFLSILCSPRSAGPLEGEVFSMGKKFPSMKEGTFSVGEEIPSMKESAAPVEEETSSAVRKISSIVSGELPFTAAVPEDKPLDPTKLCFYDRVKFKFIKIPDNYTVPRNSKEGAEWFELLMEKSEETLFPAYMGLHPFVRDILFSQAYRRLLGEVGVSDMHMTMKEMDDFRLGMKNRSRWRSIKRARLWADLSNARYDDWLFGIYLYYKDGHVKFKSINKRSKDHVDIKSIVMDVPFAKYLVGDRAKEAYGWYYFNEIEKSMRLERSEIKENNIHLLPENYTGTELQNRFSISVLAEAKMKAAENGKPVDKEVTKYIKKRILSKEVAENPTLNAQSCPGYICPLEKEEE